VPAGVNIEQVWFAGTHADVGGGYVTRQLPGHPTRPDGQASGGKGTGVRLVVPSRSWSAQFVSTVSRFEQQLFLIRSAKSDVPRGDAKGLQLTMLALSVFRQAGEKVQSLVQLCLRLQHRRVLYRLVGSLETMVEGFVDHPRFGTMLCKQRRLRPHNFWEVTFQCRCQDDQRDARVTRALGHGLAVLRRCPVLPGETRCARRQDLGYGSKSLLRAVRFTPKPDWPTEYGERSRSATSGHAPFHPVTWLM